MSTAERDETARDEYEPVNQREPLTQREVFDLFLNDLTLRPYVLAALGSLAMIFLVMFMSSSDIGAVVVVLFGLATLLFRWIAGPPFLLLILFYFQLFPFGLPDPDSLYSHPYQIRETHFRAVDVILVMAILVYIRSTYRIFGVILQSIPSESVFRRKGEHPVRRPLSHIEAGEVIWMIGIAAGLVIVGQIVWWLVNSLEFTPTGSFPVRWADKSSFSNRLTREPGEFSPSGQRFFIVLGALFFGFLFIRLVFGYWRLRMINAAEGAMMLTDTSWGESHRERVRVEKWRIWGRAKVKEEEQNAAAAERELREKEEKEREREERERAERQSRVRGRAERNGDDRPRRR